MHKQLTILSLAALSAAGCGNHSSVPGATVAGETSFQEPVMLTTVDGDAITSDGWAVPYATDVDGDGRQDLLVGQFMNTKMPWPRKADEREDDISAGTVVYYRNIGSGDTPQYAAGVDLQSASGAIAAANW